MKAYVLKCYPYDFDSSSYVVGVFATEDDALREREILNKEQLEPDETGYVTTCPDYYSVSSYEVQE